MTRKKKEMINILEKINRMESRTTEKTPGKKLGSFKDQQN
jgi:hypothetical protein